MGQIEVEDNALGNRKQDSRVETPGLLRGSLTAQAKKIAQGRQGIRFAEAVVGYYQLGMPGGTLESASRLHETGLLVSRCVILDESHESVAIARLDSHRGMFHVKHDQADSPIDPHRIKEALKACGVRVDSLQCELLARHAELVRHANKSMNLTRITERDAMVQLHIADSLAFTPLIGVPRGRGIDVGTGAGYPGIPLSILGYDVDLCESSKKKADFLRQAVNELGLSPAVLPLRAEELAIQAPAEADWVVFRAVSSLPSLVELASPLLKEAGHMIGLKGPLTAEELEAGCAAAGECGMTLITHEQYALPSGERRSVVVFSRTCRSKVKLPRRPGMAQKHPLG